MTDTASQTHFARLTCVLLVALALAACSAGADTPAPAGDGGSSGQVIESTPGPLPESAGQPQPQGITLDGCPPEGDGGDPALNKRKNRVDEGAYIPVNFDAVLNLPWPSAIERRGRKNWPAPDAAQVARYEGLPVSVVGFLADAKEQGAESANCHGEDHKYRDWHVWLVEHPDDDRSKSIVVETTPRVRAGHPAWSVMVLQQLARDGARVRIGGWLMLDPEHPDQVGKTRGTIWEIHPIMRIEVWQNGQWVTLDDYSV
ncbi:MAG: hypothetical protein HY784_08975 [Chloroflexi bacterium]|nr:hypothetical protein [Chloroflexota bacterium]